MGYIRFDSFHQFKESYPLLAEELLREVDKGEREDERLYYF